MKVRNGLNNKIYERRFKEFRNRTKTTILCKRSIQKYEVTKGIHIKCGKNVYFLGFVLKTGAGRAVKPCISVQPKIYLKT